MCLPRAKTLTGLLSKLLFHNGSIKKKVLKYGTPKPPKPKTPVEGLRSTFQGLLGWDQDRWGTGFRV